MKIVLQEMIKLFGTKRALGSLAVGMFALIPLTVLGAGQVVTVYGSFLITVAVYVTLMIRAENRGESPFPK